MRVTPTFPFAAFLGLPPRIRKKAKSAAKPKARNRERMAVQTTRKVRSATARREVRSASHKRTFAELLDVDLPTPPKAQRQPAMAIADTPALQSEPSTHSDGLTPRARRIIALGAAARGEAAPPDGIEAQLRRERDEACGIDPVTRDVIDRAVRRQASKSTNADPKRRAA